MSASALMPSAAGHVVAVAPVSPPAVSIAQLSPLCAKTAGNSDPREPLNTQDMTTDKARMSSR